MMIHEMNMWYDNKILKDIIMFWHTKYEDVQIRSVRYNDSISDMIEVSFLYKSKLLCNMNENGFSYFPICINIHKRDIRDYKISKILN